MEAFNEGANDDIMSVIVTNSTNIIPKLLPESKRVKDCHIRVYLPQLLYIAKGNNIVEAMFIELINQMFFTGRLKFVYIKKVVINVLAYCRNNNLVKGNIDLNWYKIKHQIIAQIKLNCDINEQECFLNQLQVRRNMVFDDHQRNGLLNYCKTSLTKLYAQVDYLSANLYSSTITNVEFCTMLILLFACGSRFTSMYELSILKYKQLLSTGIIQMITKHYKLTDLYIPHEIQVALFMQTILKYHDFYGSNNDNTRLFTCTPEKLAKHFDQIYEHLFKNKRPKQLRWHAARRWWSGQIFKKCGLVATSKGMGHTSILTTRKYIDQSMHTNGIKSIVNSSITI